MCKVGQPTGVTDAAAYAGIVYYEEKGVEDIMTFTVAKKLNALLEVIFIKYMTGLIMCPIST